MEYDKFFSSKTVIPKGEFLTKHELLSALVDVLKKENKILNKEEVLSSVIARESVDSTGIGNGVAFPHAKIPGLNKIVTAVARIPEGIDFIAQDRKPVFLTILICYSPSLSHLYLNLLASLSKIFQKKENVQLVVKQTTAKTICGKILELLNALEASAGGHAHVEKKEGELNEKIPTKTKSTLPEIQLLIRLQVLEEEIKVTKRNKKQLQTKTDNLRSLISPSTLRLYDQLKIHRPPAVVPIEGNICHGCYMTLSTQFVQKVQQDSDTLYTCPNCRRFVYWI